MQALPQKTTDYIAEQFRAYYERQAQPKGMCLREARSIIDYLSVSGPAPEPSGSGAIDYSKPAISGSGGRPRPSPEMIESILGKYAPSETEALWSEVFNELIEQYEKDRNNKALKLIKLSFKQQLKRDVVCSRMHISEKTFNNYRLAILTAAAIYAVSKGCNIDT